MSGTGSSAPLLAVVLLCACGASRPPVADGDREDSEARQQKRVRELAPDLYLLADRARDQARASRQRGELRAALDQDARAELLEEAARVEAARIELEREGARAEQRAERALTRAARHRRETLPVEQETRLLVAARQAREEAKRVLGQAAEQRRPPRRQPGPTTRSPDEAREFLLGRARLLLAAAVAMGAQGGPVREAERAIQQAVKAKAKPSASLRRAREALRAAERALDAGNSR